MTDEHTLRNYTVRKVGELADVVVQYFAITTEKRIENPAVKVIVESAQKEIFG